MSLWIVLGFSLVPSDNDAPSNGDLAGAKIVWTRDAPTLWGPQQPVLLTQMPTPQVWIGGFGMQAILDLHTGSGEIQRGVEAPTPEGTDAVRYPGIHDAWALPAHPSLHVVVLPSGRVLGLDPRAREEGTWTIRGRVAGMEMASEMPVDGRTVRIGDQQVTTEREGRFTVVVDGTRGPLAVHPPRLPAFEPTLGCSFHEFPAHVWGDSEIELIWFCPAPC